MTKTQRESILSRVDSAVGLDFGFMRIERYNGKHRYQVFITILEGSFIIERESGDRVFTMMDKLLS